VAALMRNACDIVVLSSQSETFGMVLIESLASGKPVVASRCGGPESIVTDASLGALCAPNDPEALAECLYETAVRLPLFDARAIRAHAVRTFDYELLADRLLELYRGLAAAPPSYGPRLARIHMPFHPNLN
jgi:glycosyltransferase involved in cell wall biosynthesis